MKNPVHSESVCISMIAARSDLLKHIKEAGHAPPTQRMLQPH